MGESLDLSSSVLFVCEDGEIQKPWLCGLVGGTVLLPCQPLLRLIQAPYGGSNLSVLLRSGRILYRPNINDEGTVLKVYLLALVAHVPARGVVLRDDSPLWQLRDWEVQSSFDITVVG